MDKINGFGNIRKIKSVPEGSITAADNRYGFTLIKGSVAYRAIGNFLLIVPLYAKSAM